MNAPTEIAVAPSSRNAPFVAPRPMRTTLPDWNATNVPVSRATLIASRNPATAARVTTRASDPRSGVSGSAADLDTDGG